MSSKKSENLNSTENFYGTLDKDAKSVLVVMAGGSGTRFWPMSRTDLPKQYLPLGKTGEALITESIARFEPLIGKGSTLVVTAASQAELVKKFVPDAAILAEPMAKNTAPCLAYAAHYILKNVGDVPMLCIPADHVIDGQKELLAIFKKASELAIKEDVLITLGIKPTSPETGYGYIKRGGPFYIKSNGASGAFEVSQFVEKPDLETAKHYVESGDYFWNSGMFVWRPSVLINALKSFLPDVSKLAEKCVDLLDEENVSSEKLTELYDEMQSVSIDVGVMEEAENAIVFPSHTFSWSDVGSWSSWSETVLDKYGDNHENIFLGDVLSLGSERCTVINAECENFDFGFAENSNSIVEQAGSGKSKIVAVVGMEDLIVVNLSDSILVCKKSDTQKVKQIVEILTKKGRKDLV